MIGDVASVLEQDLATWLEAQGTFPETHSAVPAFRIEEQPKDRVVIAVEKADPLAQGVNLFEIPVDILIETQMDDGTVTAHDEAAQAVADLLLDETLLSGVTALDRVVVSGVLLDGEERTMSERYHRTLFRAVVTCSWGEQEG